MRYCSIRPGADAQGRCVMAADRPWCSGCGESKWAHRVDDGTCEDCGSDVADEWPAWPAFKRDLGRAGAVVMAAVLFVGPPAMVAVRLWQGGPLYRRETVTRTVTEVQHTGVLVDVAPILLGWAVLLMMFWFAAHGPRRF